MRRLPPVSTLTDTLFPYTSLFLSTGKRRQERRAEIVINVRGVPHPILQATSGEPINRLVISLQPDEGLRLDMMAKVAGQSMDIQPIFLDVADRKSTRLNSSH